MEQVLDSDYYKLIEKTKVFFEPRGMRLELASWPVGNTERVYEDGKVIGYVMDPFTARQRNSLPDEFFNHQVADIDLSDESALFSFVKEWGFPFTPRREDWGLLNTPFDYGRLPLEGCSAETDPMLATAHVVALRLELEIGQIPGPGFDGTFWEYPSEAFAISLDEIRESLAIVKLVRELALEWVENPDADTSLARWMVGTYLNAATQYPLKQLHLDDSIGNGRAAVSLFELGFLTQAIANQFAETINDDAWWRACVKCGRLFKRKQSSRKNPNKKRSVSVYCSDRCHENKTKSRTNRIEATPAQ